MIRFYGLMAALFISGAATAHEMTPTYPKLEPSYMDGIKKATVTVFNRREDVSYYEFGVFTQDWKPLVFATENRILRLEYLEKKTVDVYLRDRDAKNATDICTRSKILKGSDTTSLVASVICSKIK